MALPTTGINTTMVRNELGEDGNKIGADLCKSPFVNMWSRRKPVRDVRPNGIPLSEVGDDDNGDCGLDIPGYAGDDTLLTAYLQPRGTNDEPCRIGDFRGYDHNANMMIVLPPSPAELEKKEFDIVAFATVQGSGSVALGDISGNLRLGVMVYNSGGLIGKASAQNAGGASIAVDLTGLVYSELTFKFCLTDVYKGWNDTTPMNALYEVPRELTTQNKNWENIPLVSYNPPSAVPTFTVTHDPNTDELTIKVETATYTGDIYIQYTDSNGQFKDSFTANVGQANTVLTFTDNDTAWIVDGQTYTCRLWLNTSGSGAFDAETTFTAFSISI